MARRRENDIADQVDKLPKSGIWRVVDEETGTMTLDMPGGCVLGTPEGLVWIPGGNTGRILAAIQGEKSTDAQPRDRRRRRTDND